MNLALRGIDANIEWGDSFREDHFKELKADFILANPSFNDSDSGPELLLDERKMEVRRASKRQCKLWMGSAFYTSFITNRFSRLCFS
jgi:type I restriction enzyme M protein